MNKNNCKVKIDNMQWVDGCSILIEGYCYIENYYQASESSVKKSIIFSQGNKRYILPLKNVVRTDLFENEDKEKYKMCGFTGTFDLGYIDAMDSLSIGDWSVEIHLINGGIELTTKATIDSGLLDIGEKDFVNKLYKSMLSIKPISKDGYLYFNSTKKSSLRNVIDKNSPIRIFVKGLKNFITYIKRAITMQMYNCFKHLPIKEKQILFLSESRTNLSGNFKFVYDEIVERGGYDIKTYLNKPRNLSLGKQFSWIKDVATSKYILLDDFYPMIYDFKIREEAELIQLWHACGAFKTFGFSRLGKDGGPKITASNHRNYTKAIVSSEDIKKHYAEGFGISEDKVYATGVPRTDIFFDEEYKKAQVETLYEKYPLLKDKKVIMFAPTFRGNGKETAYYDFDKLDIESLYKELNEEYVLVIKLHPFISRVPKIDKKYNDFIIDLTAEREINDLLFVSDILITDYSSVCFEFSLLDRPMIFFAYDMDEYIEKRDFYYPYKDFVPGVIAKDTDEIINIIKTKNFNNDKLEEFKKKFFTHFDGKSTKRVVDMILNS